MGKVTRSARFRPEVDAKLIEVADRRGVPLNTVLNEAVEAYLGFRTKVSQIEVPEKGPQPLVDKTAGQTASEAPERPPDLDRVRVNRSSVRCLCVDPVGELYCEKCGKIR